MDAIKLERPHAGLLDAYGAALRTGWSPSNGQDLSGPHLAAIAADPAAFLAEYEDAPEGAPARTMALDDGTVVPRLPGQLFWISDGSFCGFLSFRYQPGTHDLPETVSGHVGYGIVPWKRGRGLATAALRAVLPVARAVGLARVLLTALPENAASRRVIERVGGVLDPALPASARYDPRVGYWVPTGGADQTAR